MGKWESEGEKGKQPIQRLLSGDWSEFSRGNARMVQNTPQNDLSKAGATASQALRAAACGFYPGSSYLPCALVLEKHTWARACGDWQLGVRRCTLVGGGVGRRGYSGCPEVGALLRKDGWWAYLVHTAEPGRVAQSIGSLIDPRRACRTRDR